MIGTIRISQLPPANTLTGNETVIVNQDGDTRRTTAGDVVGLVTYVSSAGIATVAEGLTETPDISVSSLNVSGVSTLGIVEISSGIITATTGIVTYYGDGSKLDNIISGVGIQSSGTVVGSAITTLNFIGTGNTFSVDGSTINISIEGGGGSSYWAQTDVGIHTLSNVGVGTTNPTSTLTVGGDINLDDGGTYVTTLQMVTPTADRTISFPDATGTVALVAGSNGQVTYNNAGALGGLNTFNTDGTNITLSGQWTSTLNGAASAPPVSLTGTWFTGGTGTTTKPQFLVEPAGTTSTNWDTNGTGLGVNAPSGFSGNLLDLQVNGVSKARIDSSRAYLTAATLNIPNLPEYADDSAAGTGGLVAGDVYKTSTGELRIKL